MILGELGLPASAQIDMPIDGRRMLLARTNANIHVCDYTQAPRNRRWREDQCKSLWWEWFDLWFAANKVNRVKSGGGRALESPRLRSKRNRGRSAVAWDVFSPQQWRGKRWQIMTDVKGDREVQTATGLQTDVWPVCVNLTRQELNYAGRDGPAAMCLGKLTFSKKPADAGVCNACRCVYFPTKNFTPWHFHGPL